jgi:hypothetical protein
MLTRPLQLVALAAVISGCTVVPKVQYRAIGTAQDMEGMTDAFYRQRSDIVVTVASEARTKDAAGASVPVTELAIVSAPAEYRASKLGIKAVTDWRSSTLVTINKTANTDLVSSIGVEVTDNTAKAINEYGGALVKLIGLGAALDASPAEPCMTNKAAVTISLPEELKDEMSFAGNTRTTGCIRIKLQGLPPDAMKASDIPLNTHTHNYYYSACRSAEVTVQQGPGQVVRKVVRVSDPRWVQFVQFPPKGTITSHSECGVSVQTERAATDNGAAVIDALATQGKAIADALAASKGQ